MFSGEKHPQGRQSKDRRRGLRANRANAARDRDFIPVERIQTAHKQLPAAVLPRSAEKCGSQPDREPRSVRVLASAATINKKQQGYLGGIGLLARLRDCFRHGAFTDRICRARLRAVPSGSWQFGLLQPAPAADTGGDGVAAGAVAVVAGTELQGLLRLLRLWRDLAATWAQKPVELTAGQHRTSSCGSGFG